MKIVVAITGASGSLYAHLLLKKLEELSDQYERVDLIFSETAIPVWSYELPDIKPDQYSFKQFDPNNFFAPMASGSAAYDCMIVIPCTMGTMARIAAGEASDLISRTADVILKERGRLILITREAPLSLIHLKNMVRITEAGGIICPANPSFYSHPSNIEDLANTVVNRALRLTGLDIHEKGFMSED
jgi:4-hydroxy-3-polyprenylbenzoate decarboxylase